MTPIKYDAEHVAAAKAVAGTMWTKTSDILDQLGDLMKEVQVAIGENEWHPLDDFLVNLADARLDLEKASNEIYPLTKKEALSQDG